MKTIKTLIEIPAKYKWITVDEDGLVSIWTHKTIKNNKYSGWGIVAGECRSMFYVNKPKDWTKAIWRIEEYEEV